MCQRDNNRWLFLLQKLRFSLGQYARIFSMQSHDNKEQFKLFLEQKRTWYKKIDKVFCPVLNEHVIFNAKGFYHLSYDGVGKQRLTKEQFRRMNLLKYVLQIISSSVHIIEKREKNGILYLKIQEEVYTRKISVIIRKTGTGPYIFYNIWAE